MSYLIANFLGFIITKIALTSSKSSMLFYLEEPELPNKLIQNK